MQDISLKYGGTPIKRVVVFKWPQRAKIIFLFFFSLMVQCNVGCANMKAPTPQP